MIHGCVATKEQHGCWVVCQGRSASFLYCLWPRNSDVPGPYFSPYFDHLSAIDSKAMGVMMVAEAVLGGAVFKNNNAFRARTISEVRCRTSNDFRQAHCRNGNTPPEFFNPRQQWLMGVLLFWPEASSLLQGRSR